MNKFWKWVGGAVVALVLAAVVALSVMLEGRGAYGMVRYGPAALHRGTLKVATMPRTLPAGAGRRHPLSHSRAPPGRARW